MTDKPLQILVSTFACGPKWGSEIGMGWNWVINLSNYCQLHVITEQVFKDDIEEELPNLNLKYIPVFHYCDIGEQGRELFWKQGSFVFYKHYKKWQYNAYLTAEKIIQNNKIDIVHQLNMIGFREPGYLWKIENIPFIWGPVGGFNQVPAAFLSKFDLQSKLFYTVKNTINTIQKYTLKRVKNAAKRANILIGATHEAQKQLLRLSKKNEVLLMGETGCHLYEKPVTRQVDYNSKIKILWVGRLQARKALVLAINALYNVRNEIDFEFTIVGKGEQEKFCKDLVKKLNLQDKCKFIGEIPNTEVMELMRKHNFFLFPSLVEGTPHVVTEALQNGLPVICHNTCGQGTVVNETCGIKIDVVNPKNSIKELGIAIVKLSKDVSLQKKLSQGAFTRANEVSWDFKANEMLNIYKKLIN